MERAQQLKVLAAEDPSWFPEHVLWLLTTVAPAVSQSEALGPPQALGLTWNTHIHIIKKKSVLNASHLCASVFVRQEKLKAKLRCM